MQKEDLTLKQRAALLALMAEAREISNPDLYELAGFRIDGDVRRRLNERGLVSSLMVGRSYTHELTDKGWKWCAAELSAERRLDAGSMTGAFYLVLASISRYLERSNLSPADFFKRYTEASDVESQIRDAYKNLAKKTGDWVSLIGLRQLLHNVPKEDTDEALKRLYGEQQINLVPEPDQRSLSSVDRASAVKVGNEYKHLIAIGKR